MIILGIETSCDDTAIAVVETKLKRGSKIPSFRILSNIVSSQTKIHQEYGGVVPGLAKRAHQENLVPVLLEALLPLNLLVNPKSETLISKQTQNSKLKILKKILARESELLEKFEKSILPMEAPKIDLIAVTHGPGLEPALWAGVNFARALSYWWGTPLVGIDHMEGHIAANFLQEQHIEFPAIVLAVSGGHTQLILVKDILKYKLLGETVDDAAGEGFDKVARMLGLGFPGGPAIQRQAAEWKAEIRSTKSETNSKFKILNSKLNIKLPRPMMHTKDYNFSFSGLKTAVLYDYKKRSPAIRDSKRYVQEMSDAFQQAVIDVLITKTIKATKEYDAKTVMLAGGVAANTELRKQLEKRIKEEIPNTKYQIPDTKLATDNAAMIAAAAYFHRKEASLDLWKTLEANGNLKIK